MAESVQNKFFRVSLCRSKNLATELDIPNILAVVLKTADEILTEDYQFLEPTEIDYKEDLVAKLEDDIFLWFHTYSSFPFLARFLSPDVLNFYQWIKSIILTHGERLKKKYTEEDIYRIFTRQYELIHHRKFFELFPSSSIRLKPCLEKKNSYQIIWTLKNFFDSQQIEFDLEMNTEVTLKDLASITLAENCERICLDDLSLLPATLYPHIQTITQSYKYIQRLK